MGEVIRLEKVFKRYHTKGNETVALNNISFSVYEKEFVSIIGPSGCGKSTILSLIANMDTPSGGKIIKNSASIGYMLQHDYLFPWLTVRQNTLLGLEIQHKLTRESIASVDGLLKQYGLWQFKDSFPAQLSGGMRQRAALIRTLAVSPDVLLLDEPFSALDSQTRLAVSDDIYKIIKSTSKTAILVTHDISEAIGMSDRVIVLTSRPSSVKAIHKIELPEATPLKRRNAKDFSTYFQTLWKELSENE